MSERNRKNKPRSVALLLALGLLPATLMACGEPRDAPKPCGGSLPATPFDARLRPISLPLTPDGKLRGDPTLSPAMSEALNDATVSITHGGNRLGSGVLVNGPRGEVVLTTAHVVRGQSLHELAFTAVNGTVAPGDTGCYIDELLGGGQAEPGDTRPHVNDIAVIRLQSDLPGTKPMTVVSEQPERGTWATMQNYGTGATSSQPRRYNGFVVLDNHEGGPAIVSGIQPQRRDEGPEAYATTPGGSGGAVACMTPERSLAVCGLTVSTRQTDRQELSTGSYNLNIPDAGGLQPRIDLITPVATIQHALASSNY
jgi:hypothetical protein